MDTSSQHGMPSTHWSLVRRTGLGDLEARREALGELLTRYLPALRSYLLAGMRIPEDRVEDLIQGFVGEKVLAQELLAHADQRRGRFRSFLVASLHRYVVSEDRRERARKRGGGLLMPLGQAAGATDPAPGPTDAFDAAWARALLGDVLVAMRRATDSRPDVWGVFEARVLPEMRGEAPLSYEELASRFALKSPDHACNLLITAKRMYVRLLRQHIGAYEQEEGAIDEEIRSLRAALATGGHP